jgi:formamidopyrimidine-DNA glycosylase
MPELPDVEGFRRALSPRLPGRRITRVRALDASILRNTSPQRLGRVMVGERFGGPTRHGKWLILPTIDGPILLVHSGMTGHPYYTDDGRAERHDRLVITLDRGQFRYADQRKLRGVWLATGRRSIEEVTGPLGPDALEADRTTFVAALRDKPGALKTTLTDQSVLAGIGNLLADEICWQARLRPQHRVEDLDLAALRTFASTAQRVLRTSARHGQVPPLRRWLTGVRDNDQPHCPRCGTALEAGRVGGRRTLWCPRCQPDGFVRG